MLTTGVESAIRKYTIDHKIDGLFVEVLDDYYSLPDQIRSFALSCSFDKPFTGTWNGLQSLERAPSTQEVFEHLAVRLPAAGRTNWREIEASFRFWGRPSAGMFALLLTGQVDTVHFHIRSGTWAGVCYLSLPAEAAGRDGVRFFRHRETGRMNFLGATPDELALLRADGKDAGKWECLLAIPMFYNRMVLFDGRFFHAASEGFGTGPANGRLTQLFNIDFHSDSESTD